MPESLRGATVNRTNINLQKRGLSVFYLQVVQKGVVNLDNLLLPFTVEFGNKKLQPILGSYPTLGELHQYSVSVIHIYNYHLLHHNTTTAASDPKTPQQLTIV